LKFLIFKELKTATDHLFHIVTHIQVKQIVKKKKITTWVGTSFFSHILRMRTNECCHHSSIGCFQENKGIFAECVFDGLISDWLLC